MNNPCILTDQEEQGNLKVEGCSVLRQLFRIEFSIVY